MASAICTSWKVEIVGGTHASGNTYKIALYTNAAVLSATTETYSATNEVSGPGYSAQGATLSGFSVISNGSKACLTFSNVSWTSSTITARYALIYNSTQSNKAVCVLDFGSDQASSNGTFAINFPTQDASNSLIRF